jgi:amidase
LSEIEGRPSVVDEEEVDRRQLLHEQYAWANPLLQVDFDRVRRDRRAADARVATDPNMTLAGTFFSAKDTLAVAGVVSTGGSLVLAGNLPSADATAVARVRAAGSVLIGKGNCAEFGFGIDTESRIGGRVLHPFVDDVSPGGSSGGDAVAVACRITDFALATDYGGSVRWPAQAVGVLGLRSGVGQVPRTGQIPGSGATTGTTGPPVSNPWSLAGALDTVGVFGRSTSMVAAVFRVIKGGDGLDWLAGLHENHSAVGSTRRGPVTTIAVTTGSEILPGDAGVDPLVKAVRAAASAAGLEIIDATGIFEEAFEIYSALRARLDHHGDVHAICDGYDDLLCDETREVLERSSQAPLGDRSVAKLWAARAEVVDRVQSLLRLADAVVLPVAPVGPQPFGVRPVVGGRHLDANELMAYCRAVSVTGLPVLSVPFDQLAGGQSRSVQIVGPPGGEERCCEVAEILGRSAGLRWADR